MVYKVIAQKVMVGLNEVVYLYNVGLIIKDWSVERSNSSDS